MIRRIAKFMTAALLLGLANLASAGAIPIDILTAAGVPGTGGSTSVVGPCYCTEPAYLSPVMQLQPGTYDFGELRDFWVQSGPTPDGGPDQPNLYLLFAPVITAGTYPQDFGSPAPVFPSTALCDQNDSACNASYAGKFSDFDLTFTVQPGQQDVQVELIGNWRYTPPVPEPVPASLLFAGLALIAGIARPRHRRAAPHAT